MEDLVEIIKAAIEDERRAQADYRRGVEAARDPELRAIFQQLMRDEEAHERMLRDRLAAIRLIKR